MFSILLHKEATENKDLSRVSDLDDFLRLKLSMFFKIDGNK